MVKIDRRFGVEIEFDSNGLGYNGIDELITNFPSLKEWSLHEDGSELELGSPILQGANGFKQLKKMMYVLNDVGCFVTHNDGLHIHHDAPEFVNNIDNVIKLVQSWNENEPTIFKFVDEYRRNYGACPSWNEYDIETMINERKIISYERHSLNVVNLANRRGTIEIRLHEGTLDYDEAYSWIKFGQNFIDSVLEEVNSMPNINDPNLLLKRVRISRKAKKILGNKAKYTGPSKLSYSPSYDEEW